ncbi:MAG: hypothetical protein KDN22_14280 [Verrucomicrobiae bacterium]|nr:hypothetical protein [Verrucomicrobiae bacterium]
MRSARPKKGAEVHLVGNWVKCKWFAQSEPVLGRKGP